MSTATSYHMCLNIRGALREAREKVQCRQGNKESYATNDGVPLTWAQFEKALMIEQNKGHEVIPMNDGCTNPCTRAHLGCTGFRFKKVGDKWGCPGHRKAEEVAIPATTSQQTIPGAIS